MAPPHPTLFSPLKLGNIQLKHRVIMAPLTRRRAPEHIPGDSVVEHYAQRATDGGLLIAEATHISVMGGNYYGCPGIFTPEQVRAWKKVTDAVHKKGGYIYLQLWHVGRTTHPVNIGGRKPLGASPIAVSGKVLFTPNGAQDSVVPQEMTLEDIKNTVDDYAHAARCAIAAGFDGVEIHGANGYLLDQFLCDNINVRTDAYGGSTEKRARLMLEVTDRIVKEIGRERVGIRLSPFGFFQDTATSDILAQYGYAAAELEKRGLAYIHIIEPRMGLVMSAEEKMQRLKTVARSRGIDDNGMLSIEPFRKIIKTTPLITNGEFTGKDTNEVFEKNLADAIAYGRYFISNPDLPERIKNGWPLTPYNRKTFYTFGTEGYTDYPTYSGAKSQL